MSLHIDCVSFAYKRPLLQNLSFRVEKGERIALIGASGSGKTTLFRLLAGILKPQQGQISGCDQISYMTQEELLLPWRSVRDNMTLASELGVKPKAFSKEAVDTLLEKMGLKGLGDTFPHELSGGMRKRLSLARALLQKKPVLLLDEPFGALDVSTREKLYEELRQENLTLIMVTHDFHDALSLADRILLLDKGAISREWKIPSELREDPHFLGEMQRELRSMSQSAKLSHFSSKTS